MAKHDPRVDAYIRKSADFAKPILTYIRDVVHTAVPDVEETMKWSGRITTVRDLPPKKEFIALVKKAAALNDEGIKISRPKRAPRGDVQTPDDLAAALKKDKKARSAFEKFRPSHRREYIEWITEAKTGATRQRRLDQAVEWMSEGSPGIGST